MLKQAKSIFFLGIKGVAMANLAVLSKKIGKKVFGVDIKEEFITDELLKENKITYKTGFSLKNLPEKIDLFIYSAAHQGLKNPLAIEAKRKKANLLSQTEYLSKLIDEFKIKVKVAVAGCHGKTTTASFLSYALNKLKEKPSYLVGVPYFFEKKNFFKLRKVPGVNYQQKKYFIFEADEYGVNPPLNKTPKFFYFNPDWIITTNIDFDHPDVYQDIEKTKRAFLRFFDNKKLILFGDDENILDVIKKIDRKNYFLYGFGKNNDYQIINLKDDGKKIIFEIFDQIENKNLGKFVISLLGRHNVLNTTAVIVFLLQQGFALEKIKKVLINFFGAQRRLNLLYDKKIFLYDDYGHHPEEIKATINALKLRHPEKRLITIFQPHTYSRTLSLKEDFQKVLKMPDITLLLPIFPSARENEKDFSIKSQDLISSNGYFFKSQENLVNFLKKELKKDDIVLTIGAGDVYKIQKKIINFLKNNELKN